MCTFSFLPFPVLLILQMEGENTPFWLFGSFIPFTQHFGGNLSFFRLRGSVKCCVYSRTFIINYIIFYFLSRDLLIAGFPENKHFYQGSVLLSFFLLIIPIVPTLSTSQQVMSPGWELFFLISIQHYRYVYFFFSLTHFCDLTENPQFFVSKTKKKQKSLLSFFLLFLFFLCS